MRACQLGGQGQGRRHDDVRVVEVGKQLDGAPARARPVARKKLSAHLCKASSGAAAPKKNKTAYSFTCKAHESTGAAAPRPVHGRGSGRPPSEFDAHAEVIIHVAAKQGAVLGGFARNRRLFPFRQLLACGGGGPGAGRRRASARRLVQGTAGGCAPLMHGVPLAARHQSRSCHARPCQQARAASHPGPQTRPGSAACSGWCRCASPAQPAPAAGSRSAARGCAAAAAAAPAIGGQARGSRLSMEAPEGEPRRCRAGQQGEAGHAGGKF